MSALLTDEEYTRLAAEHALSHDGEEREKRLRELAEYGVTDVESLARHALEVIRANDTWCFRTANQREIYANDRLNTMLFINERIPERSTVFANSYPDRLPSDRLLKKAAKHIEEYGFSPMIYRGGSAALEHDRKLERERERQMDDDRQRQQEEKQHAEWKRQQQRTADEEAARAAQELDREQQLQAQLLKLERETKEREALNELTGDERRRAFGEELRLKAELNRERERRERAERGQENDHRREWDGPER